MLMGEASKVLHTLQLGTFRRRQVKFPPYAVPLCAAAGLWALIAWAILSWL